jgi:hypothetical protein
MLMQVFIIDRSACRILPFTIAKPHINRSQGQQSQFTISLDRPVDQSNITDLQIRYFAIRTLTIGHVSASYTPRSQRQLSRQNGVHFNRYFKNTQFFYGLNRPHLPSIPIHTRCSNFIKGNVFMTLNLELSPDEILRALLPQDYKSLVVMHPPSAVLGQVMEATGAEAGFVETSDVIGSHTGMADVGTATLDEASSVEVIL